MIKSKDRDVFMAVDSVEDWIEESDPMDVEQTLCGVMDYIKELEANNERWKKAIEGLTPSGSEFVNDPEFCGSYVKDLLHRQLESIKNSVRREKALKVQVAQLEAEIVKYSEADTIAQEDIERLNDSLLNCNRAFNELEAERDKLTDVGMCCHGYSLETRCLACKENFADRFEQEEAVKICNDCGHRCRYGNVPCDKWEPILEEEDE